MRRQALLLLIGLLLTACGGGVATDTAVDTSADPADAGAPTPSVPPDASAPAAGSAPDQDASPAAVAPFGEVTTVSGEQIDGAQYAGQDLALWFWAPW